MTDFWIDVILTIIVTFATVFADWLANRFIVLTRAFTNVDRILKDGSHPKVQIAELKELVDKYRLKSSTNIVWGTELSAIALSLDLSILGVWISNPQFFPFFAKWNSATTSREIPIWLILVFLHFVVLMLSITLKHRHFDFIDLINGGAISNSLDRKWFSQNKFMLSSNSIGFLSLLLSFVVITNAL